MKARVKWIEGMAFLAESGSGHGMIMDGAPDIGGRNLGPRPMEMVLTGAGGCTSIDVMMILQKSKQDVTDCWVEIEATRADENPKVFTSIHMHFVITGRNLDPVKIERAINLSHDKYCSVTIMLGKTAAITHDFEMREA